MHGSCADCMKVCVLVKAPGHPQPFFLMGTHVAFEAGSLTGLELTNEADWLASEPREVPVSVSRA